MKNTSKTRLPARTRTKAYTETGAYTEAGIEPSIAEMLAEPIVRTLMARDAVSEEALVAVIADARAQLADRVSA